MGEGKEGNGRRGGRGIKEERSGRRKTYAEKELRMTGRRGTDKGRGGIKAKEEEGQGRGIYEERKKR